MKLRYNDERHAYWLDGTRIKSVTTIAKIPDDTYRLEMWGNRQVAIGFALKPDLLHAVAAHVEDTHKLNELCEQAREVAGANDASRRGTAAHRITELHDQGKQVIATDLSTSILASWQQVLDAAGLEVIPEWMERIVIYPDQKIAGKFDRVLRRKSDGRPVIADLKTGERAIRYPHSIAIQLALYANAPHVAVGIPPEGGITEQFEEMPADLDREIGYIIHIPELGTPQVAEVDIAAGWEIAREVCFRTLTWRNRSDLVRPLAVEDPEPVVPERVPDGAPIELPAPDEPADPDRIAALHARYRVLRHHSEQAATWVVQQAQVNEIPGFRVGGHTTAQADQLERIIMQGEARSAMPWPGPPPEPAPAREPVTPDEPPTAPRPGGQDEGATIPASDGLVVAARAEYDRDQTRKAWINDLRRDAQAAGVDFHLALGLTERRLAILGALFAAWRFDGDEDVIRAAIHAVTGETFARQANVTLGACFGVLTIDEARRLTVVLDQLADGTTALRFEEDGTAVVDTPPTAA